MSGAKRSSNKPICRLEGLGRELSRITEYPLTVISAPMGYGKTTAVRDFMKSRHIRHVWLAISEACENTDYYWERLTEQISEINEQMGARLMQMGIPDGMIQSARITDMMASLVLEKPLVIVLDDYHLAENDNVNRLLEAIARHKIVNLHFVLIGRSRPRLAVEEMEAKDLLLYIDIGFFLFSDQDALRYFSLMGAPVRNEDIPYIQSIAQGWISALYLIFKGLQDKIPIEKITSVDELMKGSVYEPYPEETKKELMMLSALDGFSIELAEAVTEDEEIGAAIRQICGNNAFIILNKATGIYTIHNVFTKLLLEEAALHGIDIREVYRRAGNWYLAKENHTLAFRYLYRAGDYETILTELEKPGLYIDTSGRNVIFGMFGVLPEEKRRKHPFAYLKYLLFVVNSGKKSRAAELLSEFEKSIACMEKTWQADEIQAEIHVVKCFAGFNDIETMLYHTECALGLLNGARSRLASYQGPFSFGSPHFTFIYYKKAGTYKQLVETIVGRMEQYADLSGGNGMGCAALSLAEYRLETGDFESVEREADKAICKAQTCYQTSLIICAALTRARLRLYRGDCNEAEKLLSDLSGNVLGNPESILLNTYDLCIGYFYACDGQYDRIPRWIRDGEMFMDALILPGMVFAYVVYGKALIASGDWVRAEAMCETFIRGFDVFGNQLGHIHNYLHLAIATEMQGDRLKSEAWLAKALEIGQNDGIAMPFAENGAYLLPLLRDSAKRGDFETGYLERLLGLCTEYVNHSRSRNLHCGGLSKREIEVLRLMAKGYRQQEIADKLFISLITVKKHLQNIYQKLGVDNKTRAINRASELKII